MADYTPKQAAKFFRQVPGALRAAIEAEQTIAIIDVEGDIKQRVFNAGQNRKGGQIGKYSTKAIWVSIAGAKAKYGSQIPTSKLKPRGKFAKGNKATFRVSGGEGVARKSMYFSDGYSGFRSFMGRAVDKVNLKLTGAMSNSIASGTRANVSTIEFTNEHNAEKAEGNEKRFGKATKTIFPPSEAERKELIRRLRQAAAKELKRIFP